MSRLRIGIIAVLAIIALGVFAACGGDDGETIDVGDGEITLSDDLPDEFPDDFPIYDDADLQGSYRGESEGIEGIVATWTTGDSVDDVAAFYETELDGDNWKIQSQGDQGGLGSFFSALNSDESKAAYVYISGDGDETSILVTIGDNPDGTSGGDGSDDGSSDDGGDDSSDDSGDSGDDSSDDGSDDAPSAELPPEQDLPDDFPSDRVPLPSGARVTSSSSFSSDGTDTFFVELYSQDSTDELADHFKSELPGKGWTESLTTESNGEVYLAFAPEGGATTSGVTITVTESPVDGYRLVTISMFGE